MRVEIKEKNKRLEVAHLPSLTIFRSGKDIWLKIIQNTYSHDICNVIDLGGPQSTSGCIKGMSYYGDGLIVDEVLGSLNVIL